MKLKVGDKIKVMAGKDKGKTGSIIRVYTKTNKIVVEKLNMRTKHIKKTNEKPGQKITFEAPMDASNALIVCPSCDKPTRIGYKKLEKGKTERICKKCKETVDKKSTKSTKK